MGKLSAGILLYRFCGPEATPAMRTCRRGSLADLEVLLVHPGGPFWLKKDLGAWSIPKGEYEAGEDPIAAARREFREETGSELTDCPLQPLGEVRLLSRKTISAWAVEGGCDAGAIHSNLFSMEWPPRSGRTQEFPEVDRAEWFSFLMAHKKIHSAQSAFLDRLAEMIEQDASS
jgi:predicted NUDIX family NTP pyrophosphohydrolase